MPTGYQSGYVNGSDLLVYITEGSGSSITRKAIGHCTTHTATFNSETKDVAVKPAASEVQSARALYKSKRVVGLSAQVKCSGLHIYGEAEGGLKYILSKWKLGKSVQLELMERATPSTGDAPTPYCSGNFTISSLEHTAGASDDVTYDVTFDNDGALDIDDTALDHDLLSS